VDSVVSHHECPHVFGNSNILLYEKLAHPDTYCVFVVHLKFIFVTYGVFAVAVYLKFIIQ